MEDVRQLLSDGADIQEPGLEQTSSLHIAVWWIGNEGNARLLLMGLHAKTLPLCVPLLPHRGARKVCSNAR